MSDESGRSSTGTSKPSSDPVAPGTDRVMVRIGEHVWKDPETGNKFAVSPKGGTMLPLGQQHPNQKGGKKGRSGRPPDVWKQFVGAQLKDPVVQARYRDIVLNAEDTTSLRAIQGGARLIVSPPPQAIDVTERVQVFVGGGEMGYAALAREQRQIEEGEAEEVEEGSCFECGGPTSPEDDICEKCSSREDWDDLPDVS